MRGESEEQILHFDVVLPAGYLFSHYDVQRVLVII